MIYNNVTNALQGWCATMTQHYHHMYEQERSCRGQSLRFFSYLVTEELGYKLGTLIDRDFLSFDSYKKAVEQLLPWHIDHTLQKKLTEEEACHVHAAEAEFLKCLESFSSNCAAPDMPYCRILQGREAAGIAAQFKQIWGYDTTYWYPLNGQNDPDKLFISEKRAFAHWDELQQLLGLPQNRIFEYGDPWYDMMHCAEVDHIESYGGCERAYCPNDFSWIIYFSHEETVTFAGSILPQIKQIYLNEQPYWNRFESD